MNPLINTCQTILKSTPVIYFIVLLSSVLGGGTLIRFYGETCGINLFDPMTWGRGFVIMGSPLCKGLNWACYTTSCIVEHLWIHLIGLLFTTLITYIPGKFTIKRTIKQDINHE